MQEIDKINNSKLPPLPEEFSGIDVFVVGGWVRDVLRNDAEPSDVDLMVTGVEADELRSKEGFTAVENETFPVFFDSLGREVAIAREERSDGSGHTDFDVFAVPAEVNKTEALRRDLLRRDLTVNSMAVNARTGKLFDPHNGKEDLENGIIRHTSDHFSEDPLRVLRGARFAARLDATIDRNTAVLMRNVAPEISELPEERIRMEMEKNFKQAQAPSRFFRILNDVDALEVSFPRLHRLRNVPAGPPEHHGEGSTFAHTMLVIDRMHTLRGNDPDGLLAALVHDFGKLETPKEEWPSHHGHGDQGLAVAERFANRLSMSNHQRRVMRDACRHHMRLQNIEEMNEATIFDLVAQLHVEPDLLVDLVAADSWGRIPGSVFPQDLARERLQRAVQAMDDVTGRDLIEDGRDPNEIGGEKFGKLLRDRRIERMHTLAGQS
jgi:tRNA nucleotidyltransferase (CCA-adding enzyme)